MRPLPSGGESSPAGTLQNRKGRRCLPCEKRKPLPRLDLRPIQGGYRHGKTGPPTPPIAAAYSCHIHPWIFQNSRASAASHAVPPACRPLIQYGVLQVLLWKC